MRRPFLDNWKWVQSYGGYAGELVLAKEVDYSQTLVLINSSQRAFWYKNGELIRSYTIKKGKDGWAKDKLVMHSDGDKLPQRVVIVEIKRDTLRLSDYCMDCYSHLFVR